MNDNVLIFEDEFMVIHVSHHTHLTMSYCKWIHNSLILRHIAYLLRHIALLQILAKTIAVSIIVIDTKSTLTERRKDIFLSLSTTGFSDVKSYIIVPISH